MGAEEENRRLWTPDLGVAGMWTAFSRRSLDHLTVLMRSETLGPLWGQPAVWEGVSRPRCESYLYYLAA